MKKIKETQDKVEEEKNIPDDMRTMNVINNIANIVDPMIKMTVDAPSCHDT